MQTIDITPANGECQGITHMKILDAKVLTFDAHRKNDFTEISDLAYDHSEGILYAINDIGKLFHLRLSLKKRKIDDIGLIDSYTLKSKKGKPYKKSKRDSEGLALYKGDLLVSFERRPRVILFDKKGKHIKKMPINKELKEIDAYRDPNDALEAVTYHETYGIITAPEIALQKQKKKHHTLYSEKQTWRFKAKGEIAALEVMPDGDILVLERTKKKRHRTVTLQKVNIGECKKKKHCPSTVLARLKSKEGWTLDNFEGLTHLYDDLYLMISDDNDSKKQQTIAVLMEIPSR